jgi:hypothetical protein
MSADRPEALRRVPTPSSRPRKVDPQGKRSLFSEDVAPPSVGSVALQCTKCQKRSVVSMVKAAKLAFPSVYVPAPGRTDRVWMKCPACKHRAWIHVKIKG